MKSELIACESFINLCNELEIAEEGIFNLLGNNNAKSSWSERLFGKVRDEQNITNTIRVAVSKDYIQIHGVKVTTLQNRIRKYYADKSIENIFLKKYDAMSYKRYLKKKISKSQLTVDFIYVPVFFALELVNMFEALSKRYKDKTYHSIAVAIYDNTWLSSADVRQEIVPLINTEPLSNLNLELKGYQKEFISNYNKLKSFLNLNGYILAFEQGLGKTLTALGLFECLKKKRLYIVCPNSLKENWALEIKKYYKKYTNEELWKNDVIICDKSFDAEASAKAKVIITNNESISKMYPYINEDNAMLVIDESHNFRNLKGKRVTELIELSEKIKCEDILVMSGTPIKATPAEIVPVLFLLDPSFNMEAAKVYSKAFSLSSSLGSSIVQARFGKIMYRKEKDELPNLPNKIINTIDFTVKRGSEYEMTWIKGLVMELFGQFYVEEIAKNKEYRDKMVALVDKYSKSTIAEKNDYISWITVMNTNRSKSLHELDQEFMASYLERFVYPYIKNRNDMIDMKALESRFIKMEKSCLGRALGQILPKYRRSLFIELYEENKDYFIEKINSSDKKTVIFSQFKGVIDYITNDLNAHDIGTVKINGDVVSADRMNALRSFHEDDMVRVLSATSQTLSTGVTLIEANQMFFFGPPWRSADFDQCCDRIHRIGQTDDVNIYNVILDTADAPNLSTRMDSILQWSQSMFNSLICKTNTEDIEKELETELN